jgi:hypothetical protein
MTHRPLPHLSLVPALCLSAAAAGCIPLGESESPPKGATELTLRWAIQDVSGAPIACPSPFSTIQVLAQSIPPDDAAAVAGPPFTATFDCAAGTGAMTLYTSGVVPHDGENSSGDPITSWVSGRYDVVVQITEATGEVVQSESFRHEVDLTTGPKTVETTIYPRGGFVLNHWALYSPTAGSFVSTCAAVRVDTIELRYRPFGEDTAPLTVDRYPCMSVAEGFPVAGTFNIANGLSRPLSAGDYVGEIVALDNGAVVGSTTWNANVRDGNRLTENTFNSIDIPGR